MRELQAIKDTILYGLNPCYSGICSVSAERAAEQILSERSLNPCYSGICSVSSNLFVLSMTLNWS